MNKKFDKSIDNDRGHVNAVRLTTLDSDRYINFIFVFEGSENYTISAEAAKKIRDMLIEVYPLNVFEEAVRRANLAEETENSDTGEWPVELPEGFDNADLYVKEDAGTGVQFNIGGDLVINF